MNRASRELAISFVALVTLGLLLPVAKIHAQSAITEEAPSSPETRIVMVFDTTYGEMERPPTLFDHNRHTKELKDKDCKLCHAPDEEGKMTYEFLRVDKNADKRDVIDAYHDKCLGCHGGNAEGSENAKELACGDCHVENLQYQTFIWYRAMFSHARHIDQMEKGCNTCHHKYDEETGKLTYEKGDEATCGSCHKEEDEGKTKSLRKAGHTQCIACHVEEYPNVKKEADPYACAGCHKPEEKPVEVAEADITVIPYQKEPTKLLMSYPGSILPPVPFDHKKHLEEEKKKAENKDSCAKSCHPFHARTLARVDARFVRAGDACQQCHLVAEVKAMTDGVEAEQIYHNRDSELSCRGCHIKKNKEVTKEEEKSPETCKGCHTGEIAVAEAPEQPEAKPEPFDLTAQPEGPETYVISRLSKKRLPVKFPHARHVKMIENCKACHHESPEKEFPTCYACHGTSNDFTKKAKLKLVSSYHRMCIGCHTEIGDGPITCNKCHEEQQVVFHASDQPMQVSTEE